MSIKFMFALFPLILLGTPIYAQIDYSPCLQYLETAKKELNECLEEAISHEDKISCEEKKEARTRPAKTVSAKLKAPRKTVGPAASERTRRRYAVIKEKQIAAQQSSRPVRSSLEGRKRRAA